MAEAGPGVVVMAVLCLRRRWNKKDGVEGRGQDLG